MTSFSDLNRAVLALGMPLQWFPMAKRQGNSLRVGNLAGKRGTSLWIDLLTGNWKDHATGDGGKDAISLFAAKEHLTQGEAKKRLTEALESTSARPSRATGQKPDNAPKAVQIWQEAQPLSATPAQSYLEARGISLQPLSLRYHPALLHGPSKTVLGGMVAAVTRWPEDEPQAIHRTFLQGDNKADLEPNRMMLGSVAGGAVRLGCVLDVMALAEGIETALSVQQSLGLPCWAVLSASNYLSLKFPDTVKEITIAADNDDAGLKAAHEAAEKWSLQGRNVRVINPPLAGTDFNDLHRGVV